MHNRATMRTNRGSWVCVAILALAALGVGCAPMTETRSETVVSNQKIRLSERREPKLDVADVSAIVDGNKVIVRTDVQTTCMVREGETVQVNEHIERKKDGWGIATEVTIAVIGAGILGMAIYGADRNCGDSSGACTQIIPGIALGGVLFAGGGTAAIVDLSKKGSEDHKRTDTKPAKEETAVPCADSRRGHHKVTIGFPTGSASGETDDSGIAKIAIPGGTKFSSDGVLDVEVKIDDKPGTRLQLRQEKR